MQASEPRETMQEPSQVQQENIKNYPKQKMKSGPLSKELSKIGPPKKNYIKEIILLIVLLFLIGLLIVTIVFRDTIIGWFS
jgi:hypothetical protein